MNYDLQEIELENVLSLFDGHSGMQISLVDSGIKFKNYYASEIDKHAIKVTQHNFPNTIQLGSVVDVDVSKLPKIDIVSAGSPCQSFSFAGKRKGMSTTCNEEITTLEKYLQLKSENFEFEGQSYLFWEFMRILRDVQKINPDVLFLLENVEMGKKWESVLSHALGIFGVHINSTLVSAQNRKRIYWTNIRTRQEGLFGDLYTDIPQPEDRKIFLKDVLETNVDEKYYLSDKMLNYFDKNNKKQKEAGNGFHFKTLSPEEKGNCLTANYWKMSSEGSYIVAQRGRNPDNPKSRVAGLPTEQMLEPRKDGKTNCLTSVQKDNYVFCLTPKRTEYGKQIRKEYESGEKTAMRKEVSQLAPREDGKTNTITTVQKDNLVMQLNPSKESGGNQPYQQNRVYDINGKMTCLDFDHRKNILVPNDSLIQIGYIGNGNSQVNRVYDVNGKSVCLQGEAGGGGGKTGLYLEENEPEYRIRRLTPGECKKLQTVPDWVDLKVVSDTQQYRMLGNGWNIETIKHILSYGNFAKRH